MCEPVTAHSFVPVIRFLPIMIVSACILSFSAVTEATDYPPCCGNNSSVRLLWYRGKEGPEYQKHPDGGNIVWGGWGKWGKIRLTAPGTSSCDGFADSAVGVLWAQDPDHPRDREWGPDPELTCNCGEEDVASWPPSGSKGPTGGMCYVTVSGGDGAKSQLASLSNPDGPISILLYGSNGAASIPDHQKEWINASRIIVSVGKPLRGDKAVTITLTIRIKLPEDCPVEDYPPECIAAEYEQTTSAQITVEPRPKSCEACKLGPTMSGSLRIWYHTGQTEVLIDGQSPRMAGSGSFLRDGNNQIIGGTGTYEDVLGGYKYFFSGLATLHCQPGGPPGRDYCHYGPDEAGVEVPLRSVQRPSGESPTSASAASLVQMTRGIVDETLYAVTPQVWEEVVGSGGTDAKVDFRYDVGVPNATTWYDYDDQNRVTSISGGASTRAAATELYRYGYHANGQLSFKTGCGSCGSGAEFYEYDVDNQLTRTTDGSGTSLVQEYDYAPGINSITRVYRQESGSAPAMSSRVVYDYDRLVGTFRSYNVTKYNYVTNSLARVGIEKYESAAFTDPTRTYVYDSLNPDLGSGNQHESWNKILEYDVNSHGQTKGVRKSMEVSGCGVTKMSLFSTAALTYGLLEESWLDKADQKVDSYKYEYKPVGDGSFRVTKETTPRGGLRSYSYDTDLLQSSAEPDGMEQHFTYDGRRRVTKEWKSVHDGATSVTTLYRYDFQDNVTRLVEAAGTDYEAVTTYGYDIYGHQSLITDPRGFSTTRTYAPTGALLWEATYATADTSQSAPVLTETRYEYDGNGRLNRQISAHGDEPFNFGQLSSSQYVTTLYVYDGLGRKVQVVEDEGGLNLATRYEYNNQDEVVKTTTPGGVFTEIIRDGRGLQTMQIVGFEGSTTDQQKTTHYAYDADGSMTSMTTPSDAVTTYDYDGFGRRTKMTED